MSDFAKDTNVPTNDLISRRQAIEIILNGKVDEDDSLVECAAECNSFLDGAADDIRKMPSAQPDMLEDGTLIVTVPKGTEVGSVLVQEEGTHFGALYYSDPLPEQEWIPVENEPPKEKKHYWVCTDTGYQCECRWTNELWAGHHMDKWVWSNYDIPQYSKVVAWMPLPEPWRGEEHG